MILPTKHISAMDSLLGVGSILLHELQIPRTVTSLWERVKSYPQLGTFDRYLLALDMLYLIDAIEYREGLIRRAEA